MNTKELVEALTAAARNAGVPFGPHERVAAEGQTTIVWNGTNDREVAVTIGGPLVHVRWMPSPENEPAPPLPTVDGMKHLGHQVATFLR